jgi:hypothetical protein
LIFRTLLRSISTVVSLVAMALSGGCDESLPARVEPQRYLRATLDVVGKGSTVAFQIGEVQPSVLNGALLIDLKNLHDEALQEAALPDATVEIWLRDSPDERTTVPVRESNLVDPTIVRLGVATLAPKQSASFLKQWNHRTGQGKPFWEFVNRIPGVTPRGAKYYLSDPVNFVAKARVQLFRNVQPEQTDEIEFSVSYMLFVQDF